MPDDDHHNPVHFPIVAVEHHIVTFAKPDHLTGFSGREPVFGFEKVLEALYGCLTIGGKFTVRFFTPGIHQQRVR